jgi:hypothetical protein
MLAVQISGHRHTARRGYLVVCFEFLELVQLGVGVAARVVGTSASAECSLRTRPPARPRPRGEARVAPVRPRRHLTRFYASVLLSTCLASHTSSRLTGEEMPRAPVLLLWRAETGEGRRHCCDRWRRGRGWPTRYLWR